MAQLIKVEKGQARPVNPHSYNSEVEHSISLNLYSAWSDFESTVQWHDCPDTPDGDHMGERIWQQSDEDGEGKTIWKKCYNPFLATSDTRQIWRIVSQPQENKTNPMHCEYCNMDVETSDEFCPVCNNLVYYEKEEAKTVEGETELKRVAMIEAKSYFTGWDDLNIGIDTYYWAFQKGAEYASQQNKALIEENTRLIKAIEYALNKVYTLEHTENGVKKHIRVDLLKAKAELEKALKPTP